MNGSPQRRKVVALILSGIFPGLGQFYNRQPFKGMAFVVAGGVLTWLSGRAIPGDLLTQNPPGLGLLFWPCVLLIVWCWSLIDAWRAAYRSGSDNSP